MGLHSKYNFQTGEQVEVYCDLDGYRDSYWEATIVGKLGTNYMVEYSNFVEEDNEPTLLKEIVMAENVRPLPPKFSNISIHEGKKVDAFYNDVWWIGTVCGKSRNFEDHCFVYFETTGEKIAFPPSELRPHMEWINGKWVSSKKRHAPGESYMAKKPSRRKGCQAWF